MPFRCRANCRVVPSTPNPYFTLRRKLMDEASSKYFVGQETSPMRKPKCTHCASIWLSKTKSSEFSSSGKLGQHLAAEGAVAGVVLGKLDAEKDIFERGQQAVGDVFVKRHAAAQGLPADNARAEHDVVHAVGHHAGHRGHQQRRVLVIGVHHDDDVGARRQRFAIAGLLVAAVTVVAIMHKELQAEALAASTVPSEL